MNPQKAINFNVLSEAFEIVKARWQPFVLAGLIAVVTILVVEGAFVALFFSLGMIGSRNSSIGVMSMLSAMFCLYLTIFFIAAMIQAGFSAMAMKAIEGGDIEVGDFFIPFRTPIPYLVAGLLIALASMLGIAACFVGSYVVQGLLMFVYPYMYYKKLSPVDAIKASVETLKSQWLMATAFWFVAALIGGLGAVACYVGILFTMPIMFVAKALVFRDLVMTADPIAPTGPFVEAEHATAIAELDENKPPAAEPEPDL